MNGFQRIFLFGCLVLIFGSAPISMSQTPHKNPLPSTTYKPSIKNSIKTTSKTVSENALKTVSETSTDQNSINKNHSHPISIAYWDIENLYDTIPSLFYDDSDYTPFGRLGWNHERYERKVRQVAQCLDTLSCSLTIVYGVETEHVTHDIALRCKKDFTPRHHTLNSLTGKDFSLFYFGDKFIPLHLQQVRSGLMVEALFPDTFPQDTIDLLLFPNEEEVMNHLLRQRQNHPTHRLLLMGRCSSIKSRKIEKTMGWQNPFSVLEKRGQGNQQNRGKWFFHDRILLDPTFHVLNYGTGLLPCLLPSFQGAKGTYQGRNYEGGISRKLPIFITLY